MGTGVVAVLLVIGLLYLFAPRATWVASVGWKIRDAKPSDIYLVLARFLGGILCVAAVVIMIISTIHSNPTSQEHTIRNTLNKSQITSALLDGNSLSTYNPTEVKGLVLDPKWADPTADYKEQGSFSCKSELDLHFAGGGEVSVFDMGNDQFGISDNALYPEYTFDSSSLEGWFSNH